MVDPLEPVQQKLRLVMVVKISANDGLGIFHLVEPNENLVSFLHQSAQQIAKLFILLFCAISNSSTHEDVHVFLLSVVLHPLDALLEMAGQGCHLQLRHLFLEPFNDVEVSVVADVQRYILQIVFPLQCLLQNNLSFACISCSQVNEVEPLISHEPQHLLCLSFEQLCLAVEQVIRG